MLLRAWRDVAGARLVILGDGPERARLEALAGELDIVDSVEFRGMVTDVSEYVRSADVFVLPSASEGLSVSLLEAMASGIAPVCSAVGSAPELIEDGNNGLLVPPGDVPALTTALRHTIENTTWRLTAGAAAHTLVTERFDLDRVARHLADLYQDILQR
ncbi:MAG: hypothetical protein AVDCRST_MAG93-7378 [uncultured Chloroflexia bacterium]|uniref:Uncharacterized protein n=1 Tax=uncultured Chloroflexia bacterium TaxID=1672391 RepID=A0A6J4MEL2_9CHLR|nr:MAG: hypothetical protein AVDCRST_MAG93-7378 [uncultured Chloroflexia bacterium]